MSGGVDSSVAAHLLVQQGYDVVGVFMRHGERTEVCAREGGAASSRETIFPAGRLPIVEPPRTARQGCCSALDALDAQRVADRLDIPFYALDLQRDFSQLIDYFVAEYSAGRTPNPCVMCNHWLKFGKLFEFANSIDATYVATGHYARVVRHSDPPHPAGLYRGRDRRKDQSYVLFGISTERLPRVLLPLGDFEKPRIRELAAEFGLRVAQKPDSQEICFVAPGEHSQFVRARTGGDSRGEFVDREGRVLGHHDGIERFTIGQRKGLRIALGEPRYVVQIDADTKQVVLGTYEELACDRLVAQRMHWLVGPPRESMTCLAQIRYNSSAVPCRVLSLPDDRAVVEFHQPVFAVAPGQAVVLYAGDQVLGGGWIESSVAARRESEIASKTS